MTVNMWLAVCTECTFEAQQLVVSSGGKHMAVRVAYEHLAVIGQAKLVDVDTMETFTGHRLHGVAPNLFHVHLAFPHSLFPKRQSPAARVESAAPQDPFNLESVSECSLPETSG